MKIIDKAKAVLRFQSFHGRLPVGKEISTVTLTAPEIVLEVGELYGVMYKVNGIKEPYLHKFGEKSRPLLYVSEDGKQLYAIGGKYIFGDRGFIG